MAFDDGLVEVLDRNAELLENKTVLITGNITSLQCLKLLGRTSRAFVVCDNYEIAKGLSAMIGEHLGSSSFERADKKHLTIFFAKSSDKRLQEALASELATIDNADGKTKLDSLVVLLNKTKSLSQKQLVDFRSFITEETDLYLLGANAIGAKSADSLVKKVASVTKLDSARKSTIFSASVPKDAMFDSPKVLKDVTYHGLTLKQEHGLFSQGELDQGTKELLEAMHLDLSLECTKEGKDNAKEVESKFASLNADLANEEFLSPLDFLGKNDILTEHSAVLDLGCGSGIIGLTLAKRGFTKVVGSDVSATALSSTMENAELNKLKVSTIACNMLPTAKELNEAGISVAEGKFDLIATNPPFHDGIAKSTAHTVDMLTKVKDSLNPNGILYLVCNTCLHYEEPLREAFDKVEVIKQTTKFTVFKAVNA